MLASNIVSEVFELPNEMRIVYLNRRIEELNKFKTMNDAEKLVFAQYIGHKIAGSAQSYGYLDLEPIAREMEKLKSTEIDKCRRLIDSFKECLTRIQR